ncbi:MAG: hypothetical protein LUG61_08515 [Lachnospiraceae bacterium]|nr:hypothetical protein [Lachnospiraceae bacterium]
MKLKRIKFIFAVTLTVGLLVACSQSENASQESTENVQSELAGSEAAEESGTSIMKEDGTSDETKAEVLTKEGTAGTETENASMAELITPVRIYGAITDVWADQNTIVVDNQSEASSSGEIELIIDTENTLVLDASTGYPVSLGDVQTGSFEAYLGETMTLSLPPQITPYVVIVNIPEDYGTPQYAIAEKVEEDEAGGASITATDGRSYVILADTQIVPYRTKNIVSIDDIQVGSACLIWLNKDGTASKVQIFE